MILLSHPTANQNVRQTALALAEADLLAEFWTCVSWHRGGLLDRSLGGFGGLRNELRRRSFPDELAPFLRSHAWREWGRQLAGQLGWSRLTSEESSLFSVDAVYSSLDRRVARRLTTPAAIGAVYAYDAGALASFREARRHGLKCIYEHPIIYWRLVRQLQREEAELHPEWASTLGALADSDEKLARKDEELALADVIITPSTFSKESLALAPGIQAPVRVIPYGANSLGQKREPNDQRMRLRVLFVGSLTQAKGLGYLLEAVARLAGEIDFTLIGRRVSATVPAPAVLDPYRWIPSLPHDELLQEMSRHDVLVLPSLHEGFGLVMSEAMSQGLVVITTPHTGGRDLIVDGVDGFLVPIRSADAIEEKLALLGRDRDRLAAMQEAAQRKAASLTWENYRQAIVHMAREVMEKEPIT
ncbi:MAG: glycosyltransferase family 4 protein [Chthoniobacterales bacterium]|nr:glycosyltransferase family 4 protein [Chthoniobacterales bacterium]